MMQRGSGSILLALGLAPGPRFSEILEDIQSRQLEGTLTSHEAALEWVKTQWLEPKS